MKSWFKWNGTLCTEVGVMLTASAPIIRGEEAVTHITIPGRSGELTLSEGNNIFRSYIQTLSIAVFSAADAKRAIDWLSGDGNLTLSTQPGYYQKARVIGAVTLNRLSSFSDKWVGEVQFYCDPIKRAVSGGDSWSYDNTAGGSFGVQINVPQSATRYKPLVECETRASNIIIRFNGVQFKITGIPTGVSKVIVDSDIEVVIDGDGNNLTSLSSGEFPSLHGGTNQLTFNGVLKVDIDGRAEYT